MKNDHQILIEEEKINKMIENNVNKSTFRL